MKLPKIPIDYSRAGSGEAPFDVKVYLFHFKNKDTITCCWEDSEEIFSNLLNDDEIYNF